MKRIGTIIGFIATFMALLHAASAQQSPSRIRYAGRDIFVSGLNIAWSSASKFGQDLGPDPVDTATFKEIFANVRENGGNILRLWLHTNGSKSPVYDANGFTTGPGPVAILNLRQILDLAQRYDLGMILCLWTHNMLSTAQLSGSDTTKLTANMKLLTDTAYTMAYIRNALIPMVDSLKGNPAIASWEIFNEAEGITNEFGWSGLLHVPMADIVRCVNLMAGAIHRTDPSVLVTTGAVTFQTQTDVNPIAKSGASGSAYFNSLPASVQSAFVAGFNSVHQSSLTIQEYRDWLDKIALLPNQNYYSDVRLVAAGGDQQGTLNYYSVHYYANNGLIYSPFRHPASYWGLDKPLVVAEFHMNEEYTLPHDQLFPYLFDNGYAGAMVWSWTDFPVVGPLSATETWQALKDLYTRHHGDIVVHHVSGKIYSFAADSPTIEKTDSTILRWDVEAGSTVTLNGAAVAPHDSLKIAPLALSFYTLIASGQISDTASLSVNVLPSGRIMTFKAVPPQIGIGESTKLYWHAVKGASAMLNGSPVRVVDSLWVHPDASTYSYTLRTSGDVQDSSTIAFSLVPPDQVDRVYGATVTASSNDTLTYSFSRVQNLVDGNNFSRWQAASTPTSQWIQIDMGTVCSVKTIVIRWANKTYARLYNVQASVDLDSFTTVTTVRSGTGGTNYVETLDNLTATGRYLIFSFITQGNGAYSISEIYVYGTQVATGIRLAGDDLPKSYELHQNYPNPFNPTTSINFSLVSPGTVRLTIYNVLGQIVAVPVDARMNPGSYTVNFDASRISSGVYFYRLEAGTFVSTKKMLLLK